MMETIVVSLIVKGEFKNVIMTKDMLGDLSLKLREEGVVPVHLAKETVLAEGVVVFGKGAKHQLMVFSNHAE
ncbi:hypothetical protein ACFYKX_10995 [Cytobacillus sp. FJAT-54145]|uniref:DUF2007 domain-containing protein n=1 Tax=Cytobacillus spartinae TaxID=3299023 RepID=A0ABW6KCY4_9BACI